MSNFITEPVYNILPTKDEMPKPESIRMVSVIKRVVTNVYIRTRLAEAQNWKCCWCGVYCTTDSNKPHSATIEHVTPRSEGGEDHGYNEDEYYENYAMACGSCNSRRGSLSVEDMLAGNFANKPMQPRNRRRRSGQVASRIRTGLKLKARGWMRVDGTTIDPEQWIQQFKIQDKYKDAIREGIRNGG